MDCRELLCAAELYHLGSSKHLRMVVGTAVAPSMPDYGAAQVQHVAATIHSVDTVFAAVPAVAATAELTTLATELQTSYCHLCKRHQ